MLLAVKQQKSVHRNTTYKKNNSIKFETNSIKSSLRDYYDAFILVTAVTTDNGTGVTFKNCAPFSTSEREINDVFIDEAKHIHISMPMYNLIEYSENYSDKLSSGSLWQFKRDEFLVPKRILLAVNKNKSC